MGEQDEAGRAEALPPPLVPPPPPDVVLLDFLLPPQPAATSARITAMAASAPTNSRLFTLPPPSRNVSPIGLSTRTVAGSIRLPSARLQPQTGFTIAKS